jgi:hypothetical protein
MSNLLVLILAALLMSCASFENSSEISFPGHQYGRQMDEKSIKSGFMER